MIAKVKAIAHGATDIAYINGESVNKKHPEKIFHLLSLGMADDLDAEGVWAMMKLSIQGRKSQKPMKNTLLRIELSPDRANVEHFTEADWKRLWYTFVQSFDRQELRAANGAKMSRPTNIAGSRYIVCLHHDSKSGIPHLHAAVCRVDMDGNTNNDHQIHTRAQNAAVAVSREFGWKTSADARRENIAEINSVCYNALRAMPRWNLDDYFDRIRASGYKVDVRPASDGRITGYTILKGNARYKASVLGKGRNLLAKNLEDTWRRMHPASVAKPVSAPKAAATAPQKPIYTEYKSGYIVNDVTIGKQSQLFFLPPKVNDIFNDEFDYREYSNSDEMRSIAVALFAGWLDAVARESGSGGGGSSSDLPWGRDPREDEIAFARRCANRARQILKPQPRKGRKR